MTKATATGKSTQNARTGALSVSKKVAITGATSFIGVWLIRECVKQGWKVFAHLRKPPHEYSGLKRTRLDFLKDLPAESVEWVVGFEADAQDPERRFETWILKNPGCYWIHHHHFMDDFRSPDYQVDRARQVGLAPLPGIVRALSAAECPGVIYTGSYFEPGEGGPVQISSGQVPTPYAQSKRWVWDALQENGEKEGLLLSKCVIPNPFGPMENEDRLIPQLILKARQKQTLQVSSPQAVGDQLPIQNLVQVYAGLLEALHTDRRPQIARPSGIRWPLLPWVQEVDRELLQKRLGFAPLRMELGQNPPTVFLNSENEIQDLHLDGVWDEYARYVQGQYSR